MPRRETVSIGWVATLYLAVVVALAYPLSLHPGTTAMSRGPDTDLFVWTLAWDTHAFTHQPLSIFDANIYHPQRHTLAYSENLIGSAFLAAPVIWLTGNPVLAMNLVALASAVLCGLGTFLLGRRAGLGTPAATLAGLVFAFTPPRFLRLEQLHLTTIEWVPFCLASLLGYLDGRHRRDLWLAIGFFTLQALTSGHGVVFLIVAILALLVYRAARDRTVVVARTVRDAGLVGAALLLPTILMFLPYVSVQREMGLRRTLENWTVSAASFLASPSHVHVWVLSFFPTARINETADAYLFPGILPIVLALAGVLLHRRQVRPRRDMTLFFLLLTLIGVWLSVGPPASIWPLVYWLPGFNLIRVPSRFMLLGALGLGLLCGLGFERLTARLSPARVLVAAVITGALLVGEFTASPFETEAYAIEIPAIDRWLTSRPAPFVVAEVPLANPANLGGWERRQTLFMLHATAHWQKTVHGYSGFRPPLHQRLYDEMTAFPDAASLRSLSELGVTYVVVHTDLYPPGEWARVEQAIAGFTALTLEHVEGDGRVYRLE